ncbi:MAG: hypothetical protein RI947_665 [Candidatus Parcubacteria bacterium]|jgi:hypothetical protein
MAPERSERDETTKFTSEYELAESHDAVQHRAALNNEGQIAATDLERHRGLAQTPEVIMPDDLERAREKPTLIEQAVGERKDLAQYVYRYLVTKTDKIPEMLQQLRRHTDGAKLDSFYRILLSMGADIKTNPLNGDPIGVEFQREGLEKYKHKAELENFPVDKLWKKARVVETEIRDQFGEQHKVTQLELSVSLEDWRKITSPLNDKRSHEAQELAKDIEVFLETTYMYDTGCKDAPMKWYTDIDANTLGVLSAPRTPGADNDQRIKELLGDNLNPHIMKALYSEAGVSRGIVNSVGADKTFREIFNLEPPLKNKGQQWMVIQGNHGYTGFGDLMKIPTERMALTIRQSLERASTQKPQSLDAGTAKVLASLNRALGKEQQLPPPRVWTVVMDGMGINGNMAPAEVRAMNPNIEDTYDCYANQIDFASTVMHTNIEAGWSMGGWACVLAIMKRLEAAEHIKGAPLTQDEIDHMDSYLPYTLAITPAMADTCWFSMVTPSQIEEMKTAKSQSAITPPLETHIADLKKTRKQRIGFFVSRNMLGLGSIMHKLNAGKVEPLKTTFEFFSKLYTGKIFPKDTPLTSDEKWIQTAALAHAEGFTQAGNGSALDWQRQAINHTRRPSQRGLELLHMARGYVAEFVGNQDLLVRDKDLWREIHDQAAEVPAFELPAGHALLGQDCFQEFPFAIGALMKSQERRAMQDILSGNADYRHNFTEALRLFEGGSHKRQLAHEFMKYGEKYKVRFPKKEA